MTRLSVNVDHVATLREARGTRYPAPVVTARIAERAGATGITVHLRGDRRHIQENDVREIRAAIQGKLNLEMATTEEMVAIALATRPDQVTLVPERPEEVTTEGGLDLLQAGDRALQVADELAAAGIDMSVFIDPAGRLRMVTGTPGGSTIITTVLQTILNVVDHGMDVSRAVLAPRVHHQHLPDQIFYEPGGLTPEAVAELRSMGHTVVERADVSGDVQAILVRPDGRLEARSDPRRGGAAAGY